MRKFYYLSLCVFIGLAFSSCSLVSKEDPNFKLSDLQGLWLEDKTEHYVRFTTEKSDEAGYLYGREWDNADWDDPEMTYEEYLIWNREQLGYPGNGWFKYLFETSGSLTEIHLMDNGGADIPKVYVVSVLNSTTLKYYEKNYPSIIYSFQKMVETNE